MAEPLTLNPDDPVESRIAAAVRLYRVGKVELQELREELAEATGTA